MADKIIKVIIILQLFKEILVIFFKEILVIILCCNIATLLFYPL
jgi:hypothetical protein